MSSTFYKSRSHGKKVVKRDVQAKDVMYDSMINFKTKAKIILERMMENVKGTGKSNYAELKVLYMEFRKCEELCIDIAHKLAPYQSPKLESIEVKQRVEHRYVMRVPHQMKTTEDWAKATGATKATIEELSKISKTAGPERVGVNIEVGPDNEYEDEYLEPGMPSVATFGEANKTRH